MSLKRQRFILISIGAVLFLLFVVVITRLNQRPTINFSTLNSAPNNFSAVAPYGPTSVVFSNSRSFVNYNYQTGAATLLSPDSIVSGLQNIDQLYASSNGNYLIFHVTLASLGGMLNKILVQDQRNPNTPSWWLYSIKSHTFLAFPQTATSVKFDNGQAAALLKNGDQTTAIATYALPSLTQVSTISVPSSVSFYPVAHGFVLNTSSGESVYTVNGITSTELAAGESVIGVSADSTTAYGISGEGSNATLETLSLSANHPRIISTDIAPGSAVVDAAGDILYETATASQDKTTELYLYSGMHHQIKQLTFSSTVADNTVLLPAAVLGSQTAVLKTASGAYYIAGNQLASIKEPPSDYAKLLQVEGTSVALDYYQSSGSFIVALNTTVASAQLQAIYKQLQSDGLNPYLQNLELSAYTPMPAIQ